MSAPSRRVGPYIIEGQLGRGAVAEVFRARREGSHRPVALKVLREGRSRAERQSFVREAGLARHLENPSLVRALDADLSSDQPWIAYELVEGMALKELLKTASGRAQLIAPQVMTGLLDALRALHTAGLSHRDVNPANVLISDRGKVFLADLGSAHEPVKGKAGTPAYLAPEACRGEPWGPAADLYQVAATVYEILTGYLPYEDHGASFHDLRRAPSQAPTPADRLAHGVSPAVVQLLASMLDPDPARRPGVELALERARAIPAPWIHVSPAAGLDPAQPEPPSAPGKGTRGPRRRDAYVSSEPVFYYKEEDRSRLPAGVRRFLWALLLLVLVAAVAVNLLGK